MKSLSNNFTSSSSMLKLILTLLCIIGSFTKTELVSFTEDIKKDLGIYENDPDSSFSGTNYLAIS